MKYEGIDRKRFKRLKIPGATVNFSQRQFKRRYSEEFCPVVDLSRGGIRFLCRNLISTIVAKISLQIYIPGERFYLNLKGRIKWTSLNPTENYKYQIGVQFNPFGEKKEQNRPDTLERIIEWERKLLTNNEFNAVNEQK
jgi:hypothetical protein